MAITKMSIGVQSVSRFTVAARALRQCGRTSDRMVRAGLETWVMRTNANREDRELSVQELETVTGGFFGLVAKVYERSQERSQETHCPPIILKPCF
jgi:hypothetical protein